MPIYDNPLMSKLGIREINGISSELNITGSAMLDNLMINKSGEGAKMPMPEAWCNYQSRLIWADQGPILLPHGCKNGFCDPSTLAKWTGPDALTEKSYDRVCSETYFFRSSSIKFSHVAATCSLSNFTVCASRSSTMKSGSVFQRDHTITITKAQNSCYITSICYITIKQINTQTFKYTTILTLTGN